MDKPDKRRKYDAAFKAETLRLASESRSTQAARAPHIDPKMLYKWRQDALSTYPIDPGEAAEVRQLRAANKPLAQELEILKKPLPSAALR
jgi:transposase